MKTSTLILTIAGMAGVGAVAYYFYNKSQAASTQANPGSAANTPSSGTGSLGSFISGIGNSFGSISSAAGGLFNSIGLATNNNVPTSTAPGSGGSVINSLFPGDSDLGAGGLSDSLGISATQTDGGDGTDNAGDYGQ